jgi:hypothetical protein
MTRVKVIYRIEHWYGGTLQRTEDDVKPDHIERVVNELIEAGYEYTLDEGYPAYVKYNHVAIIVDSIG